MPLAIIIGILLLGTLAVAEDARAQSPFITFGKDPEDPDYLEGADVEIHVDATVVEEGDTVTVTCLSGCPNQVSYTHTFTESEANPAQDDPDEELTEDPQAIVVFATEEDFPEAARKGEPRWEATWEVSVDDGSYTRKFWTHLADEFDVPFPLEHYEPSVVAKFQASGYGSSTPVEFTVLHGSGDEQEEVFTTTTLTDAEGKATTGWHIPVSLAERLDCPPEPGNCRDFELQVTPEGEADKGQEVTEIRIDPAVVRVDVDETTHPDEVERTERARSNLSLGYRGSMEQDVGKLPLGPTPTTGDTLSIDVHLQRIADPQTGENETCGATDEGTNVTTVEATWTPAGYAPTYVPPRDFKLKTGGSDDRFRWAIAAQEDAYGNHIKFERLSCFDINPYRLKPTVHSVPDHVERKRNEAFVFNFTYADGTAFRKGDNATQLDGALVPMDPDGTVDNTTSKIELTADHLRGGLWVWSHKLPKDFGKLGRWRFEFEGPPTEDDPDGTANDEWGNELVPNKTGPFQVKVASPLVSLTTSVDGEARNETEGLQRGDHVELRARTTYPDGSSINGSDLNHNFSDKLPLKIIKKDEDGVVTHVTKLGLHEVDQTLGTWRGDFDIPKVAAGAPVGTWDFQITARDNETPPNENVTRFPREVRPDTLHVSTLDPPAREVLAGRDVSWAFVVRDGDGERITDEDTGDAQTGAITVDVRRWNNGKPGEFVATGLEPNFNPNRAGGAWVMTWSPPKRTLEPGLYLFSPNGTDIHGNPVEDRARSRPFEVDIQHVPRDTIVSPPLSVERSQNVTVIFDGRTGDTGRNGSTHPAVRLERLTTDGRWVIEEPDLHRGNRTGAGDHLASWNTTTSTPADTYRFHLMGRAPDGSIIDATSDTFEVKPQDVTRRVLEPLVPFAKKGTEISAVIAHKRHDSLRASGIRISGPQGIADAPGKKDVTATRENWTVSWTIPVTVPKGEYVMHVQGEDKFGNNVTATLGPVRAGPVNLTVESLRLPEPEVPRNVEAEYVFRTTYPDDTLMKRSHGRPNVVVLHEGTPVTTANVTFDGVNWHATWTPPPDADLGTYKFRVEGRDKATNPILPRESRAFRVEPGTVVREVREGPPGSLNRFDPVTIQVEATSEDRFVEFQIEHYGARNPTTVGGPTFPEPQFTGRLSHQWRPSLGAYQVEWTPPKDQNTGWYRVTMEGEDARGNTLEAATQLFEVRPTRLEARWVESLEDPTPGKTATWPLEIRYPDGEPMTPRDGEPAVFVRLNGRPVEPQPDLRYDQEEAHWKATWSFPNELPPGAYGLVMRGTDAYGNTIPQERTTPVRYEPGTLSQLTGATVPGPGAGLAALAVAVTAVAGRSLLSRR